MALVTCHYCLGEGEIFNGSVILRCPKCKGDGLEDDLDADDYFIERIFPDDREQYDDDIIYSDDD
jgi:hypothetical protein